MHVQTIDTRTGRSWRADPSSIDPGRLADAGAALAQALQQGPPAAAPGLADVGLVATARGKCLEWSALRAGAVIARGAVGAHSRCGARIWRELMEEPGAPGDPARQPPTPWAAVSAADGAAPALADLAGLLALAWMSHRMGAADGC